MHLETGDRPEDFGFPAASGAGHVPGGPGVHGHGRAHLPLGGDHLDLAGHPGGALRHPGRGLAAFSRLRLAAALAVAGKRHLLRLPVAGRAPLLAVGALHVLRELLEGFLRAHPGLHQPHHLGGGRGVGVRPGAEGFEQFAQFLGARGGAHRLREFVEPFGGGEPVGGVHRFGEPGEGGGDFLVRLGEGALVHRLRERRPERFGVAAGLRQREFPGAEFREHLFRRPGLEARVLRILAALFARRRSVEAGGAVREAAGETGAQRVREQRPLDERQPDEQDAERGRGGDGPAGGRDRGQGFRVEVVGAAAGAGDLVGLPTGFPAGFGLRSGVFLGAGGEPLGGTEFVREFAAAVAGGGRAGQVRRAAAEVADADRRGAEQEDCRDQRRGAFTDDPRREQRERGGGEQPGQVAEQAVGAEAAIQRPDERVEGGRARTTQVTTRRRAPRGGGNGRIR